MRKQLAFALRITLAVILGTGPLLTLASPVSKPPLKDSANLGRKPEPARASFASKLLYKRPAQNAADILPGQTTTLLTDGGKLKIGGLEPYGPISSAVIEDSHSRSLPSVTIQRARAWHTATMLPDGRVLIVGGIGGNGQVVDTPELFDPRTQKSELLTATQAASSNLDRRYSITPRVYHTATLLTEGLVLIAGGISSSGDAIKEVQLWDFRTRAAVTIPKKLKTSRYNHTATLLANGNVLLSNGSDGKGSPLLGGELFNVVTRRFTSISDEEASPLTSDVQSSILNPWMTGSLPENGATNVPPNTLIAFRFSKLLLVDTVNTDNLVLNGPYGRVEADVVPAEGGMLAFIVPKAALFPGVSYSASLTSLTDKENRALNTTSVTFTTAFGRTPNGARDDEEWIPDVTNKSDWRSGRTASPWQSLPPLQGAAGVTALAGQVLTLDGQPLNQVTLKIDDRNAQTDKTGRFLVETIAPGHHELLIDGRAAGKRRKNHGVFEAGVEIKRGETNVLPFTIWLPKIDESNAVEIPSPTTEEVVIRTPRIPGLEVHIPPRTIIYDESHKPVNRLSITPIPVDRPPFPLPAGVYVPIYFTVQPGTGYVKTFTSEGSRGARIIYPNYRDQSPGTRHNFWHYDPEEKGWYVYGQGTVTEDGKQVVPDPGIAVYEFTGAMISPNGNPATDYTPPGGGSPGGDPVDLSTGLFVLNNTDLFLPDVLPISLTRTYRPKDIASRPFGIGSTHPYEMFLWSVTNYTQADLILPDGGRIHYVRISPGNNYFDAEYEHTATPTVFYKSRLKWNGAGWDLTLKNGTVYVFGDTTPLQSIRDRYGNKILITRTNGQSGNITKVTSPNGRWIEFSYDGSNRITQARDNIGRTVGYTYDASGRLWKVTNPLSEVTEYTYDSSHRMLTIKDARGIVYLTNQYDSNGRVTLQTQADSTTYQFVYTLDGNGKVTQTDMTDPRGNVRRAVFNDKGYLLTEIFGVGTAEQQTYTYTRESGTNFPLTATDQLGRVTSFAYDSMGNITSLIRMTGTSDAVTTSFTYEGVFNQLASVTDPLNHTTQLGYDTRGNLISVTDPLSNQTTFSYNLAGQTVAVTNALGKSVQFGYDSGDLVSVTGPLGQAMNRFVDSAGRILSITDPLGRITKFEYDLLSRPTKVVDPLQGSTNLAYDANGNLLSVTDARNNAISYAYDNMDRLQTRTDPLTRNSAYLYDNNGNVRQVTDRKSQVTSYTYDALNRLKVVTYADTSTISYTYDGGNRLTQLVDSISGTTTFTYDNLNRVTSEATPQGTVGYTYDVNGRRATMTVPGQSIVSYTYDNADRLSQISQGSATISFTYDAASRIITQSLPNGVVTEYGYDDASRIVGLTYKKSGNTLGNLTYAYDTVSRRTKIGGTLAATGLPQSLTSTNYNSANQQTGFAGQTLTYDNNGNLTSDGTNSYTWNARNQLVSMSGPGLSASFQYDGSGRRSTKTINGSTTSFLYDGLNIVQEQSGGSATANLLTGAIDQFFTRNDSSGTVGSLADALGNVIALTDSNGAIQTRYSYEPFGVTTMTGGASGNTTKFTGRDEDGTGLYYYRARYYSPSIKRFISEDPVGTAGGVNLYRYVNNNPVNFTDAFGLKPNEPLISEAAFCNFLGHAGSAAAGFGDALTGGWTDTVRGWDGANGAVDKQGGAYAGGGYGAWAWGVASVGVITAEMLLGIGIDIIASTTLKGPIASVTAKNLTEQLILEEAVANGYVIISKLGDAPRLIANYGKGEWVKMQWAHTSLDGVTRTLHWFRNLTTMQDVEFKWTR